MTIALTKDNARLQPGVEKVNEVEHIQFTCPTGACRDGLKPCAGCDLLMTRDTWGGAVVHTRTGSAALCPACRDRTRTSHEFAELVSTAVYHGYTVPGFRDALERAGALQ